MNIPSRIVSDLSLRLDPALRLLRPRSHGRPLSCLTSLLCSTALSGYWEPHSAEPVTSQTHQVNELLYTKMSAFPYACASDCSIHQANACSMSLRISSTCSSPTAIRINPGVIPTAWRSSSLSLECVVEAGCVTMVRVSPRLAERESI